jgi:hypothetical protein
MKFARTVGAALALLLSAAPLHAADAAPGNPPIKPVGRDGHVLNLDFETGDLRDWKVQGDAFAKQPIRGDVVSKRRPEQPSHHQGDYWIGGYETSGDDAVGTLTSAPF